MKRLIVAAFLIFGANAPRCASGAFVDGIETFDGYAKDTDTWEEYVRRGG
jgi:hypothetical protein